MGPGPDSFQTVDCSWISISIFEIQVVSPLAGGPCLALMLKRFRNLDRQAGKGIRGRGCCGLILKRLGSLVQQLWPLEFSETRDDELTDGRTETLC